MYLRRPSRGLLRSQVDGAAQRPGALMREYGLGAQILRDLGVRRIELLSSSGKHDLGGLDTFDLEIVAHRAMDLSAAALAEAQAALDAERTKQCTTQHCIVPPVTKGDSEA